MNTFSQWANDGIFVGFVEFVAIVWQFYAQHSRFNHSHCPFIMWGMPSIRQRIPLMRFCPYRCWWLYGSACNNFHCFAGSTIYKITVDFQWVPQLVEQLVEILLSTILCCWRPQLWVCVHHICWIQSCTLLRREIMLFTFVKSIVCMLIRLGEPFRVDCSSLMLYYLLT